MKLLVIDTETGSLDPRTGALLDIAAVELRDGEVGRTFRRRVLPGLGLVIEPEAAACNGYTPELWAEMGAVSEEDAIIDFLNFVGEVRGLTGEQESTLACVVAEFAGVEIKVCVNPDLPRLTWAGHNVAFDRGFIGEAVARWVHGLRRAALEAACASGGGLGDVLRRGPPSALIASQFSHRDVDLMHLATIPHARGVVPGRSLDDLRRTLLGSVPAVHDALTDAHDTARLLALCERRIQWVEP